VLWLQFLYILFPSLSFLFFIFSFLFYLMAPKIKWSGKWDSDKLRAHTKWSYRSQLKRGILEAVQLKSTPEIFNLRPVCTRLWAWLSVFSAKNSQWHNIRVNSQLDATIIILLIISIISTCFERQFRPSLEALDCVYSLCHNAPTMLSTGDQQAESSVH